VPRHADGDNLILAVDTVADQPHDAHAEAACAQRIGQRFDQLAHRTRDGLGRTDRLGEAHLLLRYRAARTPS